jgi:integrase
MTTNRSSIRKARSNQPGMKRRRSKPDARGRSKWQLRAYAGRNAITGKDEYRTKTVLGSEREASKALTEFVADVSRKQVGPKDRRTMADLWTQFVKVRMPSLAPATATGYDKNWRVHVEPRLGNLKLNDVTVEVLEAFYVELRTKERKCGGRGHAGAALSAWTVRHCHTLVCALLTAAVDWDWISGPHAGKRCKAPAPPSRTVPRAPKADTVKALLASLQGDLAVFARLAAVTGARRSELAALRWSDLDLETGRVSISAAVKVSKDRALSIGETKTHAARTVVADKETVELLRKLQVARKRDALACGQTLSGSWFVFAADVDGKTPVHPDVWSSRWRRAVEAAGTKGIRLHDLRHFCAVEVASGLGLKASQDQLGHSRLSTTGIYLANDVTTDAAEHMGRLLA